MPSRTFLAAVMPAPHAPVEIRDYGLGELNQALADAEAMRIPKALVRPSVV